MNLALAVGPPRPGDGYHPICSWFAPINLSDNLALERLPEGAPSRYAIEWAPDALRRSPIDWPIEKDLAVRAHRALEQHVARPLPVSMRLTKRIPVGGGLGGGSSDAAAMLLGLRELFELPLTDEALREISRPLGSDIAFFIADLPRPALVEGLGDVISPLPRTEGFLILLLPTFGCPTGPVYKAFDALGPGPIRDAEVRGMAATHTANLVSAPLFNDLAAAAERVVPELAMLRGRAQRALDRPIHITGSGSTMFIVCRDEADQSAIARTAGDLCTTVAARII